MPARNLHTSALFIFLSLLTLPTCSAGEKQKAEVQAMGTRAAEVMDIWSEAKSGIRVKATFYKKDKAQSDVEWSHSFTPSGETRTDLTVDGFRKVNYFAKGQGWEAKSEATPPVRALLLEEALWRVLGLGLRIESGDVQTFSAKIANGKVNCWSPTVPKTQRTCFQEANGQLAEVNVGPWRIEYVDFQPYGTKVFPHRIRVYELSGKLLEEIVLQIENLPPSTTSLYLMVDFREVGIPGCPQVLPASFPVNRPLNNTRPSYPTEARNNRQSGSVTYRVIVGVDGRAKAPILVSSAGMALDSETLKYIVHSQFGPMELCGKPVEAPAFITVNYSLRPY
jgi:TonB family protein